MSKVRQKRRTLNQSDKEEIGLKCCNCGSTSDLQYHHIIPISIGGKDINSNICCLCYDCHYKLHHDGKGSKVANYSELIKKGQARARLKGKVPGRIGNEITVIWSNGRKLKTKNVNEVAKLLNLNKRSVELMCTRGLTERQKQKHKIQAIYYSKINHGETNLQAALKVANKTSTGFKNKIQIIDIDKQQMGFF